MTDPGGGYGWRSGRHLPPRGGGLFGMGRIAEDALQDDRPLCVLLLPRRLEHLDPADRDRVDPLLAAPGVVAVDPARLSYGAAGRLPDAVADGLAAIQARRVRLPGTPRAVAIFHPLQYRLARALLGRFPDAALWYGPREDLEPADLHELACARAALRFEATDVLWEPMEALGVPSGRLGSERPDVMGPDFRG